MDPLGYGIYRSTEKPPSKAQQEQGACLKGNSHPLGYILWLLHSVSYLHLYHLKKDRWRFTSHVWRKIMAPYKSPPFGSGDRHLLSPQCKPKRSIFCHKKWALAIDCLSPARRSTLATRKRHPGRHGVPKKREPHLSY